MPLLYHAYVYLEFLILACTIYILAPMVLCDARWSDAKDCSYGDCKNYTDVLGVFS